MLLVPATLGRREQPVQRVLRRPVMAALGTVSYGIYLWHTVVLRLIKDDPIGRAGDSWWMLVNLLVIVAITLVIATLSYRIIERPALRLVPSTFEQLLHREPLPFVAVVDRPPARADEVLHR
jgi:peptidoglycan/LPS O-acetylase OafA/YrhL